MFLDNKKLMKTITLDNLNKMFKALITKTDRLEVSEFEIEDGFIRNINKFMIYQRDFNDKEITLDAYYQIFSTKVIFDVAWANRKKMKSSELLKDYIRWCCVSIDIDLNDFCTVCTDEFRNDILARTKNVDFQGIYNMRLGILSWNHYLTKLKDRG